MGKTKTSKKLKDSKKISFVEYEPFAQPELKDVNLTIEVLLDCIRTGDADTFRDVLYAHLKAVNKMEFVEKAGIGRRTLYDLLDPNKEFNPGFATLSALFQALEAA